MPKPARFANRDPAPEAASAPRCWRLAGPGVRLRVRLTPKSSRDAIEGVALAPDGPYLKARVRALPADGEANAALARLIATWLGVPKASVAIGAGGKSRLKLVEIAGEPSQIGALIEARLADAGKRPTPAP